MILGIFITLTIMFAMIAFGFGAQAQVLANTLRKVQGELGTKAKELESKKKQLEVAPKPICQCEHGFNVHTDEGGCQERLTKTADGSVTKQSFFCACAVYTGPVPLPQFYAPDLDHLLEG